MNNQPLIAIVLLNYNGEHLLKQYLPFILNTTYKNKTISVIDNASTDESVLFLKNNYPDIVVIVLQQNKGYAGGYNEGLRQINADYFILLNTDVKVPAGFIEPLIKLVIENPEIEICQPKILSLEHSSIFEYAGAAGGYIDKYGYTFARGRILDNAEEEKGQYDQNCEIFWASGACLLIKASLFWELNGFYEYYFMYVEEVDLCWRAQLAGKKIYYCYTSVVYHKETTKFIDQSPKRIYYVFRNNLILLMRNLTLNDKITIIPVRIFLNAAAAFLFLLQGHFKKSFLVIKSIFAALKWAFFNKEKIKSKKPFNTFKTVYKRSILGDYYFRKKPHFNDLDPNKF
ncbi:MAG: glycosyltransferase family 2 protein [Chitinophagaceae bacterium]